MTKDQIKNPKTKPFVFPLVFLLVHSRIHLFRGRRVLGDGLGALRDSMLGKFTWEDETDRGLDLARRNGRLLVVGSKLGGLSRNTLENVWRKKKRKLEYIIDKIFDLQKSGLEKTYRWRKSSK